MAEETKKPKKPRKPRLTKTQVDAFLHEYFAGDMTSNVETLAEKHGISRAQAYRILDDPERLKTYETRATARRMRAEILLNTQCIVAARKQAELVTKEVDIQYAYLNQNAAKDIMDRAGLHAKEEAQRDVQIILGGSMPELGDPSKEPADDAPDSTADDNEYHEDD